MGAWARSNLYYDALNAVMDGRDLYGELGVDPDSEISVVKRAYRDLALKLHPDKIRDPSKREDAAKRYAKVSEAYRILTDPEARAEYTELRERGGVQRVPFADRYYHRHTHRAGIPPHNPLKVFLALVLILSALKFGGQYLTYHYYRRMALSSHRYKVWAAAQGDPSGERLKLVGVKPPSWDSIFAVQLLLLPWYIYRLLRYIVLHIILRRPIDRIEYLKNRFDLSEEEVARLRAAYAAQADARSGGGHSHLHRRHHR